MCNQVPTLAKLSHGGMKCPAMERHVPIGRSVDFSVHISIDLSSHMQITHFPPTTLHILEQPVANSNNPCQEANSLRINWTKTRVEDVRIERE
jgi:hypothetical protein